ncbi:MAG: extensin family protein [Paracoccaceae bacterium]
MKRWFALVCLMALAACDTSGPEIETPSRAPAAPLVAPAPSPRGVAPKVISGFQRVQPANSGPVGPVCGDPRLIGVKIPAIQNPRDGCGVAEPVSLISVAGVAMAGKVELNCAAASALADWMETAAKPAAVSILRARLISMRPAASYVCRGRNGRSGARLSEHAKGNAVDLSEFILSDGRVLDVESGWKAGAGVQKYMHSVWKAACGPFGTVLGPNSDRHHRDHFHFDTAKHRSGAYCR